MAPPLLAVPIITAVGRFAAPYLSKELGKLGINKFVTTYGKDAFTSLNETLAADTPMVKADNVPMVNPNFASTDSDDDDPNLPMVKDQNKSNQPQQEPPEDKGPNLGTEVATEAALEISKNLSKEEDIKSQTQKALEPKVEFGPLTDTEKQTAQALMGDKPEFYSRAVDAIKNAKQNKFTKGKWKSIVQSNSTKDEMDYLGLSDYLQGNESITKQDLLDFVEQKNIADKLSVVEVPLEDQYDFRAFSIGGAGGKRAVRGLPDNDVLNEKAREGYKSTVEQYVFQVDGPEQWSADPAHFAKEYATNAIGHARAQTGYFNADAVEKRLDKKEADGTALSTEDKILKNASRQLEDTFIVDEIQSDMIQKIQQEGTKKDFVIIKGKDITQDFLKKNYPNYLVKKEPNILPGPGIFSPGFREGPIAGLSETESTNKKILEKAKNFANENQNVLYSVDPDRDITSERGVAEVRLMDNNFYVFDKKTLVTKGSYKTEEAAQELVDKRGLNPLPITESKKYVELILNAMIKKAVEKDLDSIGITNGQIQFDRYEGQPIEEKEGLKKFYDEIVYKQLEKIADKYNTKLETVELPGKGEVKEFDDVGLNEPTEESDALNITRRTQTALRDGFVLRKVKYGTLANTIESLNRGTVEGDPLPDNATLPDYASIFTETGRGAGDNILDTLIDDNPDIENEKDYYMWVKPDSEIDKAITKSNAGELMSLARVWNNSDINLQMPISSVVPSGGTDINSYNSYISEYFDKIESVNLSYPHEIIKMKLPKKLQKDILSKPIKLSKAKQQTDRLFA